jgi:hypothetical protein
MEDRVGTLRYSTLIAVLTVTIIGVPAMAMPANSASAPLGSVLQAERAHLGADITYGGATIYDGDRLETQEDGILRARLGGSQLYLRPSTIAEVHSLPNGFLASLQHGTAIVSSPEGQTFQLVALGATIRPVGTHATVAQVMWMNPSELLLTASVGAIQVSLEGDDAKTIEAGNSYRMEIQPNGSGPQDTGDHGRPSHGGRNHAIYIWISVAAVAAGIGVWRALVSTSGP